MLTKLPRQPMTITADLRRPIFSALLRTWHFGDELERPQDAEGAKDVQVEVTLVRRQAHPPTHEHRRCCSNVRGLGPLGRSKE